MDRTDLMLREYDNLWQEKLLHKESQRKFYNYVSYLSSVASLALVFLGLSTSSFFEKQLPEHTIPIVKLLCLPLPPIIILFASFVLNDAFQLYVIAARVGSLERRVNQAAKQGQVLGWESRVCPVVFGGELVELEGGGTITNVIRVTTGYILVPVLALVALASLAVGTYTLTTLTGLEWLTPFYLGVVGYFGGQLVRAALAYQRITRADSLLAVMLRQAEAEDLARAGPDQP